MIKTVAIMFIIAAGAVTQGDHKNVFPLSNVKKRKPGIEATITNGTDTGQSLYWDNTTSKYIPGPATPAADRIWFWDNSATACNWLQAGSNLAINDTTLDWSGASTDLSDSEDLLYEAELDSFSELQAQIADKTLVNEEDAVAFDNAVTITSATGTNAVHIDSTGNAQILFDAANAAGAAIWQTTTGACRLFVESGANGFIILTSDLAHIIAGTPGESDVIRWTLDTSGNVIGTGTLTGHTSLTVDNITINGSTLTSSDTTMLTATNAIYFQVASGKTGYIGGTENYITVDSSGNQSFTGDAGFYPRRLSQNDRPAAGTGSTQIDEGELVIWYEDDDDNTAELVYRDATKGIIYIEFSGP